MRLDYGTLSPLLKRLHAAGLITRERRADDERSVTVSLTETGRSLRARADCIPGEVIAATGLDAESFEGLRETLQRLTATVTRRRRPQISRRRARIRRSGPVSGPY